MSVTVLGPYKEKTDIEYSCDMFDKDGVTPIPYAAFNTLTASLFLRDEGTVIRGPAQNVLGSTALPVNGGSVHATSGKFTLKLGSSDTAILQTGRSVQFIRLELRWTYNSSTGSGGHVVDFEIKDMVKTT